jgi:hypothetical protein
MKTTLPGAARLATGLTLVAAPARAALDPGTGSYAFQAITVLLIAAGFAARAWLPRLPGGVLVRVLAVLAPPLLVLPSAHELFLRNQNELGRHLSVLYSFWGAGLAAAALGMVLLRLAHRPMGRLALGGYLVAGLGFMAWSFLRALPLGAHLLRWLLDTDAGSAVFLAGMVGAIVLALRKVDPRTLLPFFAVLAVVLLVRELAAFATRLDREPLPPPRDVVAEVGPGAGSELPNVYHLILDSFQDELFAPRRLPGGEAVLDGFVRFRTTSRSHATSVALPAILTGRWEEQMAPGKRARQALTGAAGLPQRLRGAGYRTLAVVGRHVYEDHPEAFDVTVFHDENVSEPDARALHAAAFSRLWVFQTLPMALNERLARGAVLGFGSDFFEMKGVARAATFAKPLVSRLSLERWLEIEPRLPSRGRYTLVHVALPHVPFRLRPDCSLAPDETDLGQQTDCTLRLLVRTLELLRDLDRLDDAVVLVHGDHGAGLVRRDGRFVEEEEAWYRTLLLTKASGARGPTREAPQPAGLEDIAPTLLALLGLDGSPSIEGRVLAEALPAEADSPTRRP